MPSSRKSQQLQIRVSPAQKTAIKAHARRAGMTVSDWVLSSLLPTAQAQFQKLVREIAGSESPGYAFADLLDLLEELDGEDFESVVATLPESGLDEYWSNYLAATVEHAAALKKRKPPAWTREIPPLEFPAFGSTLLSLRMHLLLNSPPAFNRRNLFVDSSVGDRV